MSTLVPYSVRAPDGTASSDAGKLGRVPVIRQFELTEKVRAYDPKADTAMLDAAYVLAMQAHGQQTRENGDPYITHPLAVADILAGYRLDTASIVTALLHDVIEDTPVTLTELERRFGPAVGGLVDGVTKLTRLELQSDRTKQAENFRKLVLAMSKDIRVLLVKLADRLHNMRTLHYVQNPERRLRIARETMEIYAPLAERIGMDALKTELQTLSFAQLEPEAFDTIQARLNFLRGQGADVIEEVREELYRVCTEGGAEPIEITGREKSPYSIWEKMQRRNVAFEQLSDIMAFRVVMPSRDPCYMALGAIHAAYPVIAGRFKDYISTPKSNGYRSLHTGVTLREPRNQKIEVQIRTAEMHDVAENGVAAHWLYKQQDASSSELQRFRWVQDLLEILESSQDGDEFLENTKLELYQDQVFCFTPKGQLIELPRGATSIDFAYAVHSQVGDKCVGAKVNGRLMPLRHELQNGDQVEIMTARDGVPSPAWERFVVTGKARARIRRYIAQQQRQNYVDAGRAALAKAFRQEGLDGSEKVLEAGLKGLKVASLDDLYVAVGNGNVGPKDVVHAAYPELRQAPRAPRMMPNLPPRPGRVSARDGRHANHRAGGRHGGALRRVLPSVAGRPYRRHCHHGEGRHDSHPRVPDARELRRDPGAVHRRGLGGAFCQWQGANPYRPHQRHCRQSAQCARQPDQRRRQARGRRHQSQDHQPPAGLLRGRIGCRGARPAASIQRDRRAARGQRGHPGRTGARLT